MVDDNELPSESTTDLIVSPGMGLTTEADSIVQGPTVIIPKQNIILDATVFSTFMSCARLSDFRFNHHLKPIHGKSKYMEMGSIVHTFMEVYYGSIVSGFFKSNAIDRAIQAAADYAKSDEVRNATPEEREWAQKTCLLYLDYYKNDSWVPLEVEKVKGRLIYEDDEIRIIWKAKFDLVSDTNQGIYPVDHKTMSQRRDTTSLNNQFMGQCVIQGTRVMFVNKIGFQTSLKPEEKFLRVPVNYTRDRLQEWQSEIVPFYAKLMVAYSETGYWPPNFTHCENKYGFCQFTGACGVDRIMREDEIKSKFMVGEPWDVNNTKELE